MKDEYHSIDGWKPKIDIASTVNAINDIVETGKQIIDNTLNDIDYIFDNVKDCVETCGVSVDNIRLRLMHRGIQYISLVTPAMCNLSNLWIINEWVRPKIREAIRRPQEPKILHLVNPRESVWGKSSPNFNEINPDSFIFDVSREAWVFIHGMLYKAVKKDGSDFSSDEQIDAFDFFANFEKDARIFNPDPGMPDPPDTTKIDIYLISFDSEMSDEEEMWIKIALEGHVYSAPNGNIYTTVAAAFWEEMKTRAEETATYIKLFLEKLIKTNRGRAITHSLGCYVLAFAAQQIIEHSTENSAFSSWWCMSPALPSDAFSNTGQFNLAPLIAGQYKELREGTSVWYSLADLMLQIIYPFGECTTSLGMTGLGVNDDCWAHDFDISKITDVHHGPGGEYMTRLGPYIRRALHTGT